MMSGKDTYIDESGTVELLKDLIRINSVNSTLVEGAPGEAEITEYIAEFMRSIGLETQVTEIAPGRPNAIGVVKGSGDGPTLLLNGHMDLLQRPLLNLVCLSRGISLWPPYAMKNLLVLALIG
jgi:acetylornithine deacetylase